MITPRRLALLASLAGLLAACGGDDPVQPKPLDVGCGVAGSGSGGLSILGWGCYQKRFTGELFVRGNTAYTTTWGTRDITNRGNAVIVWDVSGAVPAIADSVIVASGATTLGDVAVSDDGRWLVVAAEPGPLSLLVYDLANPRKPVEVGRYVAAGNGGAHTAEIATVGGKLHAFLALNRRENGARLSIVDLSTPAAPREVHSRTLATTILHDTFYRDGLLLLNTWDEGLVIVDVGGGGRGGTLAAPVDVGRIATVDGNVHNAWWFHDPASGGKRYVFVGEEKTGFGVPIGSGGDVHVVDISDPTAPREVAFYTVAGAGAHNFSMDEARGVLYAAFYNGGVRAIDVRGDLSVCTAAQRSADGRCDLGKMGRELARGIVDASGFPGAEPPYIWGVHYLNDVVYASDMANGLWKLRAVQR